MPDRLFPLAEVKRCSSCGEVKPVGEFHRNRTRRDGLQSRCKPCNITGAIRYHADHLELRRGRIAAWVRAVNARNKQLALAYLLEHPCVDCGEADPVVLEFDHLGDKHLGVAELLHRHVRWPVVAAEIAKCEVRCANCHRRRTARIGGWFRDRQGAWAAWDSNPESTN